jgi:hypothetical protein
MKQTKNPALFRTVFFVLAALAATAAFAQSHGEQLTGNLVDPAGTLGRFRSNTAPVVIHIDHYTEDAEVQRLAGILKQKGPDDLRDALWDQEAGYIRIGGGLGYPIAAARSHDQPDGGRVIRLMIDRPISQREVKLDRTGKGEGTFYQAAKVSITGDKLDVENYSPQPLKLLGVHER